MRLAYKVVESNPWLSLGVAVGLVALTALGVKVRRWRRARKETLSV